MNAPATLAEVTLQTVEFTLDGRTPRAFDGEAIFKAAERHGVEIPHLCYQDGLRADGNCRACVVEIKGERTLAPSCCRSVTAGMEVQAQSERAVKSQKMVLEMLLLDMPDAGYKWNDAGAGSPHPSPLPGGEGTKSSLPLPRKRGLTLHSLSPGRGD